MMTKKDFIDLADHIKTDAPIWQEAHLASLARFCQRNNPAFKACLWMDYIRDICGQNGGKIKRKG